MWIPLLFYPAISEDSSVNWSIASQWKAAPRVAGYWSHTPDDVFGRDTLSLLDLDDSAFPLFHIEGGEITGDAFALMNTASVPA